MTYMAHSLYLIFLPMVPLIMYMARKTGAERTPRRPNLYNDMLTPFIAALTAPLFPPWRPLLLPAGILGLIAFLLIYFWYLSLPRTLLSVNTAIYQSACVFVYIFSLIILRDRNDWRKVIAVVVCVGGVVALSILSTDAEDQDQQCVHLSVSHSPPSLSI